ncbi:hypothetical protein V5799_015156 [Amblyomma americanum]|uniref:Acid methyltransferase n=1 Tax=Amblyomma americanum TaxID=6943 RepID=A0AAQ4E0Y9_AMBAM
MLTFAREHRSHPRIDYLYLDLLADEDVARFVREQGNFQRVHSFLALQWVGDQRHAMRNIEALLAPGGECFLVFTTNLIVQDVFEAMLDSPRWAKYADILKRVIPETRVLKDTGSLRSHLADLVRATNLTPLACEVVHTVAKMGLDKERALDFFTFLNPVYELVNDAEKAELRQFTQDVIGDFKKRKSGDSIDERDFLVIHACKPTK